MGEVPHHSGRLNGIGSAVVIVIAAAVISALMMCVDAAAPAPNGPCFGANPNNGYLTFDGSASNYLKVPGVTLSNGPFTVCVWVRRRFASTATEAIAAMSGPTLPTQQSWRMHFASSS